jgi:hypothetical protein
MRPLLRRLSLRPSLSLVDGENEQLERPSAAGRRGGQPGQDGQARQEAGSSANGRVEQEAAELFIGYEGAPPEAVHSNLSEPADLCM